MTAEERIVSAYDALNRRSLEGLVALSDPEVELDLVTNRLAGRDGPYRGHQGIADYLGDVAEFWDELLVTPRQVAIRDGGLVVFGRVYARSRTSGILDLPTIWLWEVRDSLFTRASIITRKPEVLAGLRLPG